MASANEGVAGDPRRCLAGIRVYIDPVDGLLFVQNEKLDEWLMCCPHCSRAYWYKLGLTISNLPIECQRALSPHSFCAQCSEPLRVDTPDEHVCKEAAPSA